MSLGSRRRCAVLGSPIAHSLSPVLHRAAYAAADLDWSYDAHDVTEAGLADFLDGLDETWRGLSLTMPLKRSVVPLLDSLSSRAEQAQAVNTVILENHGRRIGHNTDIAGAAAAITERSPEPVRAAVVLGAGATATSALLALADLGCERVTLVVRDPQRAQETLAAAARHVSPPAVLLRDFDTVTGSDMIGADVLVSTIPASAQSEVVLRLAAEVPLVFDVVYDPWPTPLGAHAASGGSVLVSGLDLLVHQAGEQLTLMTGVTDAPLAAMRKAGEAVLDQRAARPG